MHENILYFNEIDKHKLPDVGGKGANLGELTRAGFPVPEGFCVTTAAYKVFLEASSEMQGLFKLLGKLTIDELGEIRRVGEFIRTHMLGLPIPEDVRADILEAWHKAGADKAYAVRSSATAEDLPVASFAGQLETYLNIRGDDELLSSVRKCWASLYTERAIVYRIRNGFVHQNVAISVVVQEMVFPEVSGIMFTADPVSGNRKVTSIDASFGLGEALVSGIVSADLYQVKSGSIMSKQVSEKKLAIYSLPEGGTIKREIPSEQQLQQALPDDRILELAGIGRIIEHHYGAPQDIEWALAQGTLYILQSRPITALYPIPRPEGEDAGLRVFISFGHLQNMTDAIKPLGISVLRTLIPVGKKGEVGSESTILLPAGSRLYIDPTNMLRTKFGHKIAPKILVQLDKITSNAIAKVVARDEFKKDETPSLKTVWVLTRNLLPIIYNVFLNIWWRDPRKALHTVNNYIDDAVQKVENRLPALSGAERIKFIQESTGTSLISVLRTIIRYVAAGIGSQRVLEHFLKKWLGDSRDLQYLNKSLPGNVTTGMGLELGDIADMIRGNQVLIDYLKRAEDATFYSGLSGISGGDAFASALKGFMQRYGMRGAGEIDITKPRWREAPSRLVPILLSDIGATTPGEHRVRFKEGEREAEEATQRIIAQLAHAKGGFYKVRIMSRLITAFRHLMALREHPKYMIVRLLNLFKQALLDEAETLVEKGIIERQEDIFYLSLPEILAIVEGRFNGNVSEIIRKRKAGYEHDQALRPPKVMTSDGEIIKGQQANIYAPAGALLGLPVSAGIVEGRARVVLKPEEANLEPGDILVAQHTDPAWTPLFVSARGLVTEAGGLMTHGAVIAREYGIPAVVGIDEATTRIEDGQCIRVNGDLGYVEPC